MDSAPEVFEHVLPSLMRNVERRSPCRLLDFGAGGAALYPIAVRNGLEYTGVEFDGSARVEAAQLYNIRLATTIDDLPDEYRADIVVLSEVLEHLPDPRAVLVACKEQLAAGGLLYLSTPNVQCLRARVEGARWSNYRERTHLLYFTEDSVRRLLRQAGFRTVRQLRVVIPFPHHSPARAMFQRLLVLSGFDGALRFVARP